MANDQQRIINLPLVPLRDMVVFPSMMAPFVVGRRASITALEATLSTSEKKIFLATQKDPKVDDPSMDEIYNVGVIATVVQNLKLPNQNVKVMVEGLTRAEIVSSSESSGYVSVGVRELDRDERGRQDDIRSLCSQDVLDHGRRLEASVEPLERSAQHLQRTRSERSREVPEAAGGCGRSPLAPLAELRRLRVSRIEVVQIVGAAP